MNVKIINYKNKNYKVIRVTVVTEIKHLSFLYVTLLDFRPPIDNIVCKVLLIYWILKASFIKFSLLASVYI